MTCTVLVVTVLDVSPFWFVAVLVVNVLTCIQWLGLGCVLHNAVLLDPYFITIIGKRKSTNISSLSA